MIRGLSLLVLFVTSLGCLGFGVHQYREAERWQQLSKFWQEHSEQVTENNGHLLNELEKAKGRVSSLLIDLGKSRASELEARMDFERVKGIAEEAWNAGAASVAPVAPVTPVARPRSHYPTVDPSVSRFYPPPKSAADRAADELESIETQMLLNPRGR